MKLENLGKRYIRYILLAVVVIFFLYNFVTKETFANKNPRTILDVHGEVLGFDLVSHEGTFDSEPQFEPNMPIPLYVYE